MNSWILLKRCYSKVSFSKCTDNVKCWSEITLVVFEYRSSERHVACSQHFVSRHTMYIKTAAHTVVFPNSNTHQDSTLCDVVSLWFTASDSKVQQKEVKLRKKEAHHNSTATMSTESAASVLHTKDAFEHNIVKMNYSVSPGCATDIFFWSFAYSSTLHQNVIQGAHISWCFCTSSSLDSGHCIFG